MNTCHTMRPGRLLALTLAIGMLTVVLPNGVVGMSEPEIVGAESGFEGRDGFRTTKRRVVPELSLSVSPPLEENDHLGASAQESQDIIANPHLDPATSTHSKQDQPRAFQGPAASILAADGSPLACGVSGGSEWMTTSSSFEVVRQCTLTVPYDGWVFLTADSSLGRLDGEYEAHFSISIDEPAGDDDLDRWVNVYDDAGDGTDKTVALSILKPITTGTHTFYLLGRRYSGLGTVLAVNPSLSVIPMSSAGNKTLTCGASGSLDWKTTSTSFEIVRQCTLTVPSAGWVFLSANGSLGWEDGAYEASFSAGIDNPSGDPDLDRRVNVYDDTGDGTDESVALSTLKPIAAGTHTFYFVGRALTDTSTVLAYDPTLTVIYSPLSATTPLNCSASGSMAWETTSSDFEVIRQCTLTVPHDGWVYLSADGTLGRTDGEYEANLRIGADNAVGDSDVDRWVNVYDDTGDGTDMAVALSVLKPVTTGTHTFFLLGRRYDGTGTVLVRDPTLTAFLIAVRYDIYLPLATRGH